MALKDKSNTRIDIDKLLMFRDFSTSDKTTFESRAKTKTKDKNKAAAKTKTEDKATLKTKTENKDLLDKINNKISMINSMHKLLANVEAELTKETELIHESICELQDEIYCNDSWLRSDDLDKIDAII